MPLRTKRNPLGISFTTGLPFCVRRAVRTSLVPPHTTNRVLPLRCEGIRSAASHFGNAIVSERNRLVVVSNTASPQNAPSVDVLYTKSKRPFLGRAIVDKIMASD